MNRGAAYGLSAAAIWGGMYVVSDVVLETVPPFTLLTVRLILGVVTLAGLLFQRTDPWRLDRRMVVETLGVGVIGFGFSLGAQFVGTDKSTAVNGALITSAAPAFILIFAALILRERLTVPQIAAVALATAGVVVILDLRQADISSDTFVGNLALVLAAITWGLYSVLIRQLSRQIDTLMVTLIAFIGGLMLTIPSSAIELSQRPIGSIDLGILLGILYLGVISTAVAMWLWNRAFALVDASVASLFFFAQPLTGAVLATVFLGQAMTLNLWIGGGMIVAGVLVSTLRQKSP